jgi:hypothetical protein
MVERGIYNVIDGQRLHGRGWICTPVTELVAARGTNITTACHKTIVTHNNYALGRAVSYNVAITCLTEGTMRVISAAHVAEGMVWTFTYLRFGNDGRVGGGLPETKINNRLGDVVFRHAEGRSEG